MKEPRHKGKNKSIHLIIVKGIIYLINSIKVINHWILKAILIFEWKLFLLLNILYSVIETLKTFDYFLKLWFLKYF